MNDIQENGVLYKDKMYTQKASVGLLVRKKLYMFDCSMNMREQFSINSGFFFGKSWGSNRQRMFRFFAVTLNSFIQITSR